MFKLERWEHFLCPFAYYSHISALCWGEVCQPGIRSVFWAENWMKGQICDVPFSTIKAQESGFL